MPPVKGSILRNFWICTSFWFQKVYFEDTMKKTLAVFNFVFSNRLARILSKFPLSDKILFYLRKTEINIASNSLIIKNRIDKFFSAHLEGEDKEIYSRLLVTSKSQCRQDLIIAMLSDWEQNGQVIEVGATDGIFLSNSFMLETELGWNSVLIEPSRVWHKDLYINRPKAEIYLEAVASDSGLDVEFTEAEFAELSGITHSLPSDYWTKERQHSFQYRVRTITLDEICKKHISSARFLAVSIDIEGGELAAIGGFVNHLHCAQVVLVENNGSLEKIKNLDSLFLADGHFIRVNWPFESFDSWYVSRNSLLTNKVLKQTFRDIEIIGGT